MEEKKKKRIIIILIIMLIIVLLIGILLTTNKKKEDNNNQNTSQNNNQNNSQNNNQNNNSNSISLICKETTSDKLILSMENKTETITAMGGGGFLYNVTTSVTKGNSYIPDTQELYAVDVLNNLYFLYKNKLYYTSDKETISKYCQNQECDYAKIDSNTIKDFLEIKLNLDLKAIGTYSNAGSGSPTLYLLTTNGKVINLPNTSSNDYNSCGVMYDDLNYPIDKIFNLNFYDGVNYSILLKDGTLITRKVDRENPIEQIY